MSHFCEFCQTEHSSGSCYHPGRKMLMELEAQLAERTSVDELSARVQELEARIAWQPIESAPKDARNVLIAGKYNNGLPYVEQSFRYTDGHYSSRKLEPPTHWKPLPAAPTADPREGKGDGCKEA